MQQTRQIGTTVYVYGGSGKFSGKCAFEWESPAVGKVHNFILFIAQQLDHPNQQAAVEELTAHGFSELKLHVGKPISVETLNDPQMWHFQKYYEGALAEGSSLVWYPEPLEC